MYSFICKKCNSSFQKACKIAKYCSKECNNLDKIGENNPFYGKKHSEKTKSIISKKNKGKLSGENNPFYGKKHSEEIRNVISKKNKGKLSGANNPFYGKKHSEETKKILSKKTINYQKLNKNLLLINNAKRKNFSIEDIKNSYIEYRDSNMNLDSLSDKYNLDKRTINSYWINILKIKKEDIKKISLLKQFKHSISYKEDIFFELFCKEFGEENVKRQFKIERYFYDFLLFNKLLVEYDGYYWHVIKKSKNDVKKNILAKKYNLKLFRIKENEKRKVNMKSNLRKIRKVLNEI